MGCWVEEVIAGACAGSFVASKTKRSNSNGPEGSRWEKRAANLFVVGSDREFKDRSWQEVGSESTRPTERQRWLEAPNVTARMARMHKGGDGTRGTAQGGIHRCQKRRERAYL